MNNIIIKLNNWTSFNNRLYGSQIKLNVAIIRLIIDIINAGK
jgi:hypothetical protein